MTAKWNMLDRWITAMERATLAARGVKKSEVRAAFQDLRREAERMRYFTAGTAAVIDELVHDADVPVVRQMALIKTHNGFIDRKHDELLGRACEMYVRLYPPPSKPGRPAGSKLSAEADLLVAARAAFSVKDGSTQSIAAAIRESISSFEASGACLPGNSARAKEERIRSTLSENRGVFDAFWEEARAPE